MKVETSGYRCFSHVIYLCSEVLFAVSQISVIQTLEENVLAATRRAIASQNC